MSATAAAPKPLPKGYHLLTMAERFWLLVTACRDHNWSFPQTWRDKDWQHIYAENAPHDSHQQCPTCGAMRLFNSDTMEAGPLFTKDVKQHG